MGGNNNVIIQSMCNTKTKDIKSTVKQILDLEKAGCEIIRVACLDMDDAKSIKEIKKQIHIPIVADIHYDYKIALEAIEAGVDKVRINPGNIGDENKVKAVVEKCKEKNIPIRIGVNGGSLEKDLLEKYGRPTAEAMVESAKRHVDILEKLDFYDIAISLKASDLDLCIKAYELASKEFKYPLHLGITEAGTEFSGTVKSSIGLGILLREGIGNTIRVSLSDDPIKEIKVAKEILKDCNLYKKTPTLIACPTCGRTQIDLIPIAKEVEEFLQTIDSDIKVAVMGCSVNGPGEAREADIGIAGGIKEGLLFKKGEIIKKVPQDKIVQVLKEEINKMVSSKFNNDFEIKKGKTAGFCYGVTRAVEGAEEEIKNNKNVYCLGEIVHNSNVVEKLKKQGIVFIDDIKKAKGKTIIRAHGIPKETYELAEKNNIELKDLTCPHVLKIHKLAEEYSKKDYFIILLGKKSHPEVVGIASFCNKYILIEDEDDIKKAIDKVKKIGAKDIVVIAQTTYNSKKFDKIVGIIKNDIGDKFNLQIEKTICPATEVRQEETKNLSQQVDTMIIIGDKKSSNTNKLYNIAVENCKNVIFIQDKKEIEIEKIKNSKTIGIMAGASTPKEDIEEVVEFLKKGGKDEI